MTKKELIYNFFEISHNYMKDTYEKILIELEPIFILRRGGDYNNELYKYLEKYVESYKR